MKKIALAGAVASALALTGFAGSAHAQCAWNGVNWLCAPAPAPYAAYPAFPYAYGSTYPAYDNPDWNTGYKPQWAPSMPGPRWSSGSGH